jgi:phosphatidylglycerophosphate synthase
MSALVIEPLYYYTDVVGSPEQPIGVVLAFGDAAGPNELVAGLPLVVRALLELQRAGARDLVLLIEDESIGAQLIDDPRIRANVAVRVASSMAALSDVVTERPAVVVPAVAVAHRDVYRALMEAAQNGRAVRAEPPGGLGPFVATPETLAAVQDLETISAGWVIRADDAVGRRRIVRELFEGCRKPVDGIVSRHLNRHISIFVSKRIVDTSLSPNTITLLTLLLGVAAAFATARATYGWMVIGAALLQLNSILDGVDGELARVRFQHSKLGQWLDTVCDDLANTMFYAGAAYAAFQLPHLPPWLAWCGAAAVVGSLLTMTMYYAELIRLGVGDFYALDVGQDVERSGWWAAINRGARYLVKRDFFVFGFFVAAVLGILPYMLPIMAVGTAVTVISGARITLARLARRRREA